MGRTARGVVGGLVTGALLVVALVSAIVAAVGQVDALDPFGPGDPVPARAEVLDVDDDFGTVYLDVRFTTEDGEVVVSFVDWYQDEPQIGDEVPILYERDDPEFLWDGVEYAAEPDDGQNDGQDSEAADATGAETAGWVALGAFLAGVTAAALTIVWVLRAPRRTTPHVPSPYGTHAHVSSPYTPAPYVSAPYVSAPHVPVPYVGPPGPWQPGAPPADPYAPPPSQQGWDRPV